MKNQHMHLSGQIILKQHNKVTEARYAMSALEKNIVYMLMAQLKDNDPPKKRYFISIQELQNRLKELGEDISFALLLEATGKLVTRVYEFDEPSGDRVQMSLFASVIYKEDSDSIQIELSRTIRPYLFELKFDFTSYQLSSALSMRSEYSKRIYEMLSQHKDTGLFKISVLKLKERLKLIDTSTKVEKYKVWSSFSRDVLEVAKKEINKKSELYFTYTLQKTGRKYTDIEFTISPNSKKEARYEGGLFEKGE